MLHTLNRRETRRVDEFVAAIRATDDHAPTVEIPVVAPRYDTIEIPAVVTTETYPLRERSVVESSSRLGFVVLALATVAGFLVVALLLFGRPATASPAHTPVAPASLSTDDRPVEPTGHGGIA